MTGHYYYIKLLINEKCDEKTIYDYGCSYYVRMRCDSSD